jgi:hypothetical protein
VAACHNLLPPSGGAAGSGRTGGAATSCGGVADFSSEDRHHLVHIFRFARGAKHLYFFIAGHEEYLKEIFAFLAFKFVNRHLFPRLFLVEEV